MPMTSEAMGFFASALVLLTFTMKDMRMLRIIAIFSNVAFIAYGALDWLPPVLCLHLLLLPLNLLRLKEVLNRAGKPATAHRELIGQRQLVFGSGCRRHFLGWDDGFCQSRRRCGRQCIRAIHSVATHCRISISRAAPAPD